MRMNESYEDICSVVKTLSFQLMESDNRRRATLFSLNRCQTTIA